MLIENQDEQAAIQIMREQYEEGTSLYGIERELEDLGYTNRNGGLLHRKQIQRVLQREGLIEPD